MQTEELRNKQVDGNHYKEKKIQPWDIIDEYDLDFYEGNILKYLLRDKLNVSRETDLKKLIHYAEKKLYEVRRAEKLNCEEHYKKLNKCAIEAEPLTRKEMEIQGYIL